MCVFVYICVCACVCTRTRVCLCVYLQDCYFCLLKYLKRTKRFKNDFELFTIYQGTYCYDLLFLHRHVQFHFLNNNVLKPHKVNNIKVSSLTNIFNIFMVSSPIIHISNYISVGVFQKANYFAIYTSIVILFKGQFVKWTTRRNPNTVENDSITVLYNSYIFSSSSVNN